MKETVSLPQSLMYYNYIQKKLQAIHLMLYKR